MMALRPSACDAAGNSEQGLTVTFSMASDAINDVITAPNVWLYVDAGRSPTPFLPAGKFTATWEGFLSAELRGSFVFCAELHGMFKLQINGATVIETSDVADGASPLSKPVQLNKGTNAFSATFISPASGAAFVRLAWAERGTNTCPIPDNAFSHLLTPRLLQARERHLGRELFFEHRCAKCHLGTFPEPGAPELKMDAPSLEGIGARRHFDWMRRWILDPKSMRPTARMPQLLRGPKAKEDAEAIAGYLASLKNEPAIENPPALITRQNGATAEAVSGSEPRPLYDRLNCAGCHNPPDATEIDPGKLSQKHVGAKFPKGKLAEFLLAPEAHYSWTRMPNFRLSSDEARELEGYLLGASEKPNPSAAPDDAALLERGRQLVQTSGCLNCHALKLENQFAAPKLAELHGARPAAVSKPSDDASLQRRTGCLSAKEDEESKAPWFGFNDAERQSLQAFAETEARAGYASLARYVPAEFAQRQARLLRCNACHGQIELVPPLEILGGKLKPEWSARFISGEIPHKIRYDAHPKGEPWVQARMPAFEAQGCLMAEGLAELHGYPPKGPPEPPLDMSLAAQGQKLVGKDGGFSCVSCHAVGSMLALEVFESEGPNLALSAERLLPDYFRRWVRNPLSIDPQTKMPVYFDEEGRSPLVDILGGDGDRQLAAIWEYFRLRDKMPAPKTTVE
jgi:cbb3-type cytochrome oxidase cytochrome c subunit